MAVQAFHEGEIALQKRVGSAEKMAQFGDRILRPFMPDQHRHFFMTLPMFFIASDNDEGDVWASVLYGEPGFVESPIDTELAIQTAVSSFDPLSESLTTGKQVGLLGIELPTRRRNRANGYVTAVSTDSLSIHVEQSFGNCPKYIQPRAINDLVPANKSNQAGTTFTKFSTDVANRIQRQDTFFIASRGVGKSVTTTEENGGFDLSHRGGPSGFVQVIDEQTLIFPDYVGNNFFNTFGNIQVDAQVGLLFIDFEQGSHIYLTGTAEVLWKEDAPLPPQAAKADRAVRFNLKSGKRVTNASPYRWELI